MYARLTVRFRKPTGADRDVPTSRTVGSAYKGMTCKQNYARVAHKYVGVQVVETLKGGNSAGEVGE